MESENYFYVPKKLSEYEYIDKDYTDEELKEVIIEISKKYWKDLLTFENLDNYENIIGVISGSSLWSGSNANDDRWKVTEFLAELLKRKILNSIIIND